MTGSLRVSTLSFGKVQWKPMMDDDMSTSVISGFLSLFPKKDKKSSISSLICETTSATTTKTVLESPRSFWVIFLSLQIGVFNWYTRKKY